MADDPQFVEAARMCGERIIKESGPSLEDRIEFAFKLLIGRHARLVEKEKMLSLYKEELHSFEQDQKRAQQWLSVGEYPIDEKLDKNELAAFTTVASTLMNFDEFVMKR